MEEDYTLAKWLHGEMTEAELADFQKSADYPLYEKFAVYSGQLRTPAFDEKKMLSEVLAAPKDDIKIIPMRNKRWLLKIAASLVLFFGLSYAYLILSSTKETALYASTTTFTLPDNSAVVLNAGSNIEYKKWHWDSNRKLKLDGEAYFKVAKGKKFEVVTNLGTVSVLGTQFNVKARDKRFDVHCYEGRVKVKYQNTAVEITKGESVAFSNGSAIVIPKKIEDKPEWTVGELAFEQEHLTAIVKEIERQYNVNIDLQAVDSDRLFSGLMPAKNLDVALKIISSVYHLEYHEVSKNKFIVTPLNVKK
jgi:transmembrane sensor